MIRHRIAWLAGVLAVMVAGCGSPAAPVAKPTASALPTDTATARTPAPSTSVTKVLTIVEENHGQNATFQGMPYLGLLAQRYGRTTAYRTLTHPSLPNYLAMAGGSTFGVHDDQSPTQHRISGPSVFDVARAAGRTAKTYAEAMTRPCQTSSDGTYAVKHNPWAYFADAASRGNCQLFDVPAGSTTAGALRDDVMQGALPNVGLLIPDLCHDAHDCSLSTADSWLSGWLHVITSGPDYRAGRLAVVITFDETEGRGTDSVLTVLVTPKVRGRTSAAALSHMSWSRWMTDLVGAKPLRQGANALSLGRVFGL